MSQTNCPNCGAIITGNKCEYCGTVFEVEETQEQETIEVFFDCKKINVKLFDVVTANEMRKALGFKPMPTKTHIKGV